MQYRFFTAAVALCATVFFVGCATNKPSRSRYSSLPPMGAKKEGGKINDITCQRFSPDANGYRAFIGIELEPDEPVVIGYFYCNSMSPAEDARILIGDKIKKIRGCFVSSSEEVGSIIQDTAPKSILFIDVERSGKYIPIPVRTMRHLPMDIYFPSRDKNKNSCNSQQ